MGSDVKGQRAKVVLLTFADSRSDTGIVTSDTIFDGLIHRGVWYVTRQPKELIKGASVLFYQAGKGMRGYASVEDVSKATALDQASLRQYALYHLTVKLVLTQIIVFPYPVELGPIVNMLDFISNKIFWGHSVRATPRLISKEDFDKIVSVANS
jgi:hypothetical protein